MESAVATTESTAMTGSTDSTFAVDADTSAPAAVVEGDVVTTVGRGVTTTVVMPSDAVAMTEGHARDVGPLLKQDESVRNLNSHM